MFYLSRPGAETIAAFIAEQQDHGLTYEHVGCTALERPPTGWNVDHNRILLGNGDDVFVAAVNAIDRWEMFDLGWVSLYPENAASTEDTVVAALIRHLGFWSLNASRVVYRIEDRSRQRHYFAYGTLEGHAEMGEERFMIDFDTTTGNVYYDLLAYSRPRHFMAKLGYPFTRILQKQFAKDSLAVMKRAIA